MDFILGLTLLNLAGILLVLWFVYSKKSSSINTEEIISPINKQLTDVFEYRFDDLKKEHDRESDKNTKMRTGLEAQMGEIKLSISEESNKSLQLQSRSLSEIQQRIQTQLTHAIENIQKINANSFDELRKSNNEKLAEIQGSVEKRLDESFKKHEQSFEKVDKSIGEMAGKAQQMMDSTKSIDKLNNIFERTNSKAFGQFSETYLESFLNKHLHIKDWKSQASIPDGNGTIDFMINLDGKKIGIDSKFPVTKYQDYINAPIESKTIFQKEFFNSIKKMASEISKKYLKPNYIDVLLMFLPSDSMYAEVANNEDLMENLHELKVTPISPVTLFPMIVIINNYELKLKLNKNAEFLINGLEALKKNNNSFKEEFRKLGDKIRTTQDNYSKASQSFDKLDSTIQTTIKLEAQEIVEEQKLLEME